jgi:putative ABC transport system permease protein
MKKNIVSVLRQNKEIKLSKRKEKAAAPVKLSVESELILKNFARNNQKYRYSIISMAFGMVLFITAGAYCRYASAQLSVNYERLNYDIECNVFDETPGFKNTVFSTLSKVGGVDYAGAASIMAAGFADLSGNVLTEEARARYSDNGSFTESPQYVFIDGLSFSALAKTVNKQLSDYTDFSAPRALSVAKLNTSRFSDGRYTEKSSPIFNEGQASLDLYYLNKENFKNYYEVYYSEGADYRDYSRNIALSIDIIPDQASLPPELTPLKYANGLFIIIPMSMSPYFLDDEPDSYQMYFQAKNHKEVFAEMNRIVEKNNWDVYINDAAAGYESEKNSIALVDIFSKVFVILISLIAVLNVFNTASANMLLRSREFAILRSVGISKRGFIKMSAIESGLLGGISILLGTALSLIITLILFASFSNPNIKYSFPIGNAAIAAAGIALTTVSAVSLAAKKILSKNIIETIKSEIT